MPEERNAQAVAAASEHARAASDAPSDAASGAASAGWAAWQGIVDRWYAGLRDIAFDDVAQGPPASVALCVVDMLEGFARVGPLASPRVARLAGPVRDLVTRCHERGARVVACQDSHSPESVEFSAYPSHCLAGSEEALPMAELRDLPGYAGAISVAKNNLCALQAGDWHERLYREGVRAFIVCGDCTDLCVNYLAMPLRLWANEKNLDVRVIVPANAVDTFEIDGHPADPIHRAFLHHMAGNGVEVVRSIRFA